MPTIIAYDIIIYNSSSGKGGIVVAVNNAIKHGWQPLGPVVKYSGSDYYQTVVRYEQPKSNQI